MSKALLEQRLRAAQTDYVWTLYFFNSRKQRNAGLQYETHKVRFRNNDYITGYVQQLINCMLAFQIEPISSVETYDGFNTKVSCDKLTTDGEILSDNYPNFIASLVNCGDAAPLKDKYQGYVLDGRPNLNEEGAGITFIKMANPMIPLSTKKTVMFKKAQDETLDAIDETFCRLYLVADSLIIDGQLYNFNHSFEKLFAVEQTMHKVKAAAIQKITEAGFIANAEEFTNYAQSSNSRTFVTLSNERIEIAKQKDKRRAISDTYHILMNESGEFHIASQEDAASMIKYLCYKVFEEAETQDVLEASSITKWVVSAE